MTTHFQIEWKNAIGIIVIGNYTYDGMDVQGGFSLYNWMRYCRICGIDQGYEFNAYILNGKRLKRLPSVRRK